MSHAVEVMTALGVPGVLLVTGILGASISIANQCIRTRGVVL